MGRRQRNRDRALGLRKHPNESLIAWALRVDSPAAMERAALSARVRRTLARVSRGDGS